MSPDRHGSGATRIEADLSIKRGEKSDAQSIHLSCRPRPCRPGAAGRRLGGADGQVQSGRQSRSRASRAPATSSAPAPPLKRRIHDLRHRIRRLRRRRSSASTSSCRRDRSCTLERLPDVLEATIFEQDRRRSSARRRAPPPARSAKRRYGVVSFGSERVEEASELFAFFAPGGGLEFFTTATRRCRWKSSRPATTSNLGGGGGFGPELITEGAARRDASRARRTRRSRRST